MGVSGAVIRWIHNSLMRLMRLRSMWRLHSFNRLLMFIIVGAGMRVFLVDDQRSGKATARAVFHRMKSWRLKASMA
jgi:hypothetical protein